MAEDTIRAKSVPGKTLRYEIEKIQTFLEVRGVLFSCQAGSFGALLDPNKYETEFTYIEVY